MARKTSLTPTVKPKYVDRILTAFTRLQSGQRRHSIHALTLRAQVIRDFLGENPSLTRQSKAYITKGIRKLQADGILEIDKSKPGHYVLTSLGQSGLRSARQSIGGASSGVPLNEGLLLEHMQSSLTPKKRGRPPLVRSHQETDAEHDSESDTEYEPRPKLKFKHPRTSAYTAPPEIASSSRHQMQPGDGHGSRENSPLTDLGDHGAEEENEFDEAEPFGDDEEAIQLRAELEARDEEIERLQKELEELRRTYVHPDSNQAATPHRPPSPDLATDSTRPSRAEPSVATRSRPSLGVTLTHSGSFISNVSKQPTPAPSTPDESPPENPFDSVATNENGLGPMTDESAGLNPDGDEDGDGTVDKILELEESLAARLLEMQKLEGRISGLQTRESELEQDVSDRDARISVLVTDVARLRQDASDNSAQIAEKDRELSAKEAELSTLKTTNAKLQDDRDSQITILRQDASDNSTQMAEKDRELSAKGTELSTFKMTNAKLQDDLCDRDSRIAILEADVAGLTQEVAEMRIALSTTHDQLAAIKEEKEELLGKITTQQRDISASTKDIATLKRAASEAATARAAKQTELSSWEAKYTELDTSTTNRITKLDQTIRERDDTIVALEATKMRYMSELSNLQQNLSNAESTVAAHAERVASANKQAATLRAEMLEQQKASETEIYAQKSVVQELEGEIKALFTKQGELKRDLEQLQASKVDALATVTAQLSGVEEQLRDAEESRDLVQSQLTTALEEKAKVRTALTESEVSVATLKSQVTTVEGSLSQSQTRAEELSASLNQAKQDVAASRVMAEIAVATLQSDLEESKQAVEDLRKQVGKAEMEREDIAKRLGDSQQEAARLAASVKELKESLKSKTTEVAESTVTIEQLRADLAMATAKLHGAEERIRGFSADAAKKDAEIKQKAQTLFTTESKFRAEAEEKEATIEDLRTQLTDALSTAFSAKDQLESTQNSFALKADHQQSLLEKLEKDLQATRGQAESLSQSLNTMSVEKKDLKTQLDVQIVFLLEANVALGHERKAVVGLKEELDAAATRLQEAEDEITELKESKETDATTIAQLKTAFSNFKEMQMRSLAEADSTVASAKSSPMPHRRTGQNGRTGSKPPPPFLLT